MGLQQSITQLLSVKKTTFCITSIPKIWHSKRLPLGSWDKLILYKLATGIPLAEMLSCVHWEEMWSLRYIISFWTAPRKLLKSCYLYFFPCKGDENIVSHLPDPVSDFHKSGVSSTQLLLIRWDYPYSCRSPLVKIVMCSQTEVSHYFRHVQTQCTCYHFLLPIFLVYLLNIILRYYYYVFFYLNTIFFLPIST